MEVSFFHMVVFFSKFILSKNKLYVIFIYDKKRVNKLKKRILTLLISFFFIPICAYADSNLTLLCPEEVSQGSEFSCTLKGTSQTPITSLSANINYHEDLSLLTYTSLSDWQGEGINSDLRMHISSPVSDDFNIALIKFKNINDTDNTLEIDITNIIFYDENKQEINIESIHKSIPIKNKSTSDSNTPEETSPYLSDIQIEDYNIDFNKYIYEYSLTINDEKSLSIFPTLENFDNYFEIINNDNLVDGSKIEIIVKNIAGYHRNYYLNIVKKENNLDNDVKDNNDYTYIFIIIIVLLAIINIINISRIIKHKKLNNK